MINTQESSRLADDILDCLIQQGGADAVSSVYNSLKQNHRGASVLKSGRSWRNLGRLADFESTCRDLGFTVAVARNARNQRRVEVSLDV